MQLKMMTAGGNESTKSIELADNIFARDFNEPLIHQVVTAYMATGRAGTKGQKNRSAVRGGGIKPWRQKGTGRARAGTIRSPIWRSGGVAFAAKNRDYTQKVNKKMYRAAIKSIVSELIRQQRLVIVDTFSLEAPKTRYLVEKLDKMKINDGVLLVTQDYDENVYLSARNLINVGYADTSHLNPLTLLKYEKVLITADAIKKFEETLS